jgi:hypothetical protein
MNLNTSGYASFATVAWFSNLLKGATARLQRYKQYDAMDVGDVSRALDIIAEEISNPDKRTGLPFVIEYQTEENQNVSETTTTTVRAALRHWSRFHELNKRVYNISRCMVKYGDCFFRKISDTKKWEYVDPTRVIGIEVNAEGEKVAYHIRPSSFSNTVNQNARAGQGQNLADSIEITPASAMLHFTLSDDMGDTAPFGLSILQSAFKDWQKLTMLEDSAIIYRIVRAPERRVFYLDVGNMPPQRVKQYLEQVRNDIRQKRVPNTANSNQTDSTYNPECLALDTKIPLLDGRTLELAELIKEHQEGKINWVYSCDPVTGAVVPGEIAWAGVTRKSAEVLKVTFDNGESITCTPDHKFPVQGVGFVRADELTPDMSLVPFSRRWSSQVETRDVPFHEGYEEVYDVAEKSWRRTHTMVGNSVELSGITYKLAEELEVIHHADFNKHNNHPDNLIRMGRRDHILYHAEHNKERFDSWSAEKQSQQVAALARGRRVFNDQLGDAKVTSEKNRREQISRTNQRNGKRLTVRRESSRESAVAQRLAVSNRVISLLTNKLKSEPTIRRADLIEWMKSDENFLSTFRTINTPSQSGRRSAPTWTYLEVMKQHLKATTFAELKSKLVLNNHKVVGIEVISTRQDTGCITVGESVHGYHTFALAAGVFTKNSIQEDYFFPTTAAGRGSRVETLPGGATWEIPELDYFMNKVFRALRVPTSYMRGPDATGAGAQYNDGKVGIAYIEELRFANYIQRLQKNVENVMDEQFKIYMQVTGINVDPDLFKLTLPEPQNFALYRQAALDTDLINAFKSIEETPYMSKRFMMKRYLGLTEDDIKMNESMLMQERNIQEGLSVDQVQQMYDPNFEAEKVKAEEPEDDNEGKPDLSVAPPEEEGGESEEPAA